MCGLKSAFHGLSIAGVESGSPLKQFTVPWLHNHTVHTALATVINRASEKPPPEAGTVSTPFLEPRGCRLKNVQASGDIFL